MNDKNCKLNDKLSPLELAKEDWRNSGIADDVIDLNLKAIDGFPAFDLFISNCQLDKNDRINGGKISSTIANRYNHLYDGYWYVETFNPLTGEQDFAQCKPFNPRKYINDKGVEKIIKYETPKGAGTPFVYLNIPMRIIKKIAKKYKINCLPLDNVADKWQWLKDYNIPCTITEGIKKAAALISIGIVAIASFSITTHSEKTTEEESSWFTEIKPSLKWILEPQIYDVNPLEKDILITVLVKKSKGQKVTRRYNEIIKQYGNATPIVIKNEHGTAIDVKLQAKPRDIYICFDRADEKPSSREAVNRETLKLGKKLSKQGISVFVVDWTNQDSKGIDDYLANHGIKATKKLFKSAKTFRKFELILKVLRNRALTDAIKVNSRFFPVELLMGAILEGKQIIGLKSQQNTGKTHVIAQLLKKGKGSVLNVVHRQTLSRSLADRLGIGCYLNDEFKLIKKKTNIIDEYSISICVDSLLQIPEDTVYKYIVLDEVEQVIWHSLSSHTEISKNRNEILERLFILIQNCLDNGGHLILADADLSDLSVAFLTQRLNVKKNHVVCFENEFKPFSERKMFIYKDAISLRKKIEEYAKKGKRILIHTSGQKVSSTHGSINIEEFLKSYYSDDEIYRIDQESVSLTNRKEVGITEDLGRLKEAKVIIYTNTIGTGVSLDVELVGNFSAVFGIFFGNYAVDEFEQGIERYRGDCARHIFIAEKGCAKISKGDTNKRSMTRHYQTKLRVAEGFLGDLYRQSSFDNSLIHDYSFFGARINNDLQVLREAFIIHSELKGYQITENVITEMEREERTQFVDGIKSIKDFTCVREANEVLYSPRCDKETLEQIKNKKRKTPQERNQEKLEKLHKKYGDRFMEFLEDPDTLIQFYYNELSGFQFQTLYLRFLALLGADNVKTVDKVRTAKRIAFNAKNEKTNYFLDVADLAKNTAKVNVLDVCKIDIKEIEEKAKNFDYGLLAKFKVSEQVNGVASLTTLDLLDQLMATGKLISNSQISSWSRELDAQSDLTKNIIEASFDIKLKNTEGMDDKHIVRFSQFLRRLGYGLEAVVKTDSCNPDHPIKENYYLVYDNALGGKTSEIEDYQDILLKECQEQLGNQEGLSLYKSLIKIDNNIHLKKRSLGLSKSQREDFWQYLYEYLENQLTTELSEFEQWELVA